MLQGSLDILLRAKNYNVKLRDGWRVFQEDICSPDDILGGDAAQSLAVAVTIQALLEHTHRSPKDIQPDPDTLNRENDNYPQNDSIEPHINSITPETDSIELNYNQYQRSRYTEDRYISNFNFDNQNYTFDESEEYQLNYENNNTEQQQYSPVYNNELRLRGPYYQNNRIQFVTPFCKGNGVLRSDNFEIYDTDEVDFPVDSVASDLREGKDFERYDRGKMNLDIQANYSNDLPVRVETAAERENRIFYTCLCLGGFILSAILLIVYPL